MVLGDTGVRKMRISPYLSAAFLAVALTFGGKAWTQEAEVVKPELPKKIFAHYMGCYPADAGATAHHRRWDNDRIRHDSKKDEFLRGGFIRNWPLVPPGRKPLSLAESADLEIRRAIRGGIDGFTVDAWAGGDQAKATLDALFQAAETGKYDFSITITLDSACLGKDKTSEATAAVKYLLDKHGTSPNLARRDGKPLIFGYLSGVLAAAHAAEVLSGSEGWKERNPYRDPEIRNTPKGWETMLGLYEEIERRIGQKIYFQFCIGAFFMGVNGKEGDLLEAAAFISKRMPAVGTFFGEGKEHRNNTLAPVVTQNGAEWCEPIHYQFLNHGGIIWQPKGTEVLRERWQAARKNNSTLIQAATWNDYNENTVFAPGYETRYAILDLNRHFIDWWKTGKEPETKKDKIYLFWRKYPDGVEVYPFQEKYKAGNTCIEVVTLLAYPATVRLPGRNAEYEAPAGLYFKQFPNTPGYVEAQVIRNGNVTLSLRSPEPITDKPYREALGLQAISSEDENHWKLDFPNEAPFYAAEYADSDGDGMPDWYEMYWFNNKVLDWTVATNVDPGADFDRDGKTNLEEYLERTDPTKAPPSYEAGFIWDAFHFGASTFNPDRDRLGSKKVWHCLYTIADKNTADKFGSGYRLFELDYGGKFFVRSGISSGGGNPCIRIAKTDPLVVEFATSNNIQPVTLGWQSPVDGNVSLNATVDAEGEDARFSKAEGTLSIRHGEKLMKESRHEAGKGGIIQVDKISVNKGDFVYLSVVGQLFIKDIEVKLLDVDGQAK